MRLASALGAKGRRAVIINADSAQVYADLQVLSARPDEAAMRGVEHRLYGSWDGAQACSAADWAIAAGAEITSAHDAGIVPIVVGGTGLYLRTLLDGIAPIPAIDEAVRASVRAMPLADAYAALVAADAQGAARLHPADSTRIARALEVVRTTGRTLGDWQAEKSGGIAGSLTLHPAIFLPDRAELYRRCDARFSAMLAGGAVEEVAALLARALAADLPVMRAIGVEPIAAMLRGEQDRATTLAQGAQATRNYAKRQYTWFHRQPPADWPRQSADYNDIDDTFELLLRQLAVDKTDNVV